MDLREHLKKKKTPEGKTSEFRILRKMKKQESLEKFVKIPWRSNSRRNLRRQARRDSWKNLRRSNPQKSASTDGQKKTEKKRLDEFQ